MNLRYFLLNFKMSFFLIGEQEGKSKLVVGKCQICELLFYFGQSVEIFLDVYGGEGQGVGRKVYLFIKFYLVLGNGIFKNLNIMLKEGCIVVIFR